MIYGPGGHRVEDRSLAYELIKDGFVRCERCGKTARELHNHRAEPPDWEALCTICHAEVEARTCGWTPIGMLAVRYVDMVQLCSILSNKQEARERLGWDGVACDLHYPFLQMKSRRDYLKAKMKDRAVRHGMYPWLNAVRGVGPHAASLLIAVEERAFRQGVTGVRAQRKYFGFVPGQKRIRAEMPWHETCKVIVSQALGQTVQMKKGLFGILYDEYRGEAGPEIDTDAHRHNYTVGRVIREFMKALCLQWRRFEGLENGRRHPDDRGPRPRDWVR